MKFTIVNQNEIPDDLPPGLYKTRIISATWEEIELEYIGPLPKDELCLIKIVKEDSKNEN